jgi:hypothetical protein
MAMASVLPWAAPAAHFNRSPRRPSLLSLLAQRPVFFRSCHIESSLSGRRRIFPPLCQIAGLGSGGGGLWSRRLGFQSLDWINGENISFSVSANKSLNAESFDTAEDEVASFPFHVRGADGGEVGRVIGRDELESADSESDDEDDGFYYDEDEEEDGFGDIDGEFRDNEEDAEAGVVALVPSEGSGISGKDRERLKELCARVMASGERTVTASDIADLYDFPFDKFQVRGSTINFNCEEKHLGFREFEFRFLSCRIFVLSGLQCTLKCRFF